MRAHSTIDIPANTFNGCASIEKLVFTKYIRHIGDSAFRNCTSLTEIVFEKNDRRSLGTYAFAGCSKLEKADTSCGSFDIYDAAFLDCPKLTDITLEDSNYYSNIGVGHQVGFNSSVDEEGKTVYETTPDMTIRSYVSTNTSSYAIGNGIKYIPTGGVEYTVEEDHVVIDKWLKKLWYVTVPAQIEGKPVTVIGRNAFKNAPELEDVYLPSCLKEIRSGAFMNSTAMDMSIPASVEKIGSRAFTGSRFESSYLRDNKFEVVGNGILVNYNGSDEEVVIPDNVKVIGEDAFAYHSEIEKVTVPAAVTEICGGAFYKCSGLSKIELPDSVKAIDVGAFTGCTALKTVVTGKEMAYISDFAFCDCSALSAFNGYAETYTEQFAKDNGYYFETLAETVPEEETPAAE